MWVLHFGQGLEFFEIHSSDSASSNAARTFSFPNRFSIAFCPFSSRSLYVLRISAFCSEKRPLMIGWARIRNFYLPLSKANSDEQLPYRHHKTGTGKPNTQFHVDRWEEFLVEHYIPSVDSEHTPSWKIKKNVREGKNKSCASFSRPTADREPLKFVYKLIPENDLKRLKICRKYEKWWNITKQVDVWKYNTAKDGRKIIRETVLRLLVRFHIWISREEKRPQTKKLPFKFFYTWDLWIQSQYWFR